MPNDSHGYATFPISRDIVRIANVPPIFPFKQELSKVVQFTEILETGPNGHIGTAELLLEGVKWIKSLDPNMPVVISHGTNVGHQKFKHQIDMYQCINASFACIGTAPSRRRLHPRCDPG